MRLRGVRGGGSPQTITKTIAIVISSTNITSLLNHLYVLTLIYVFIELKWCVAGSPSRTISGQRHNLALRSSSSLALQFYLYAPSSKKSIHKLDAGAALHQFFRVLLSYPHIRATSCQDTQIFKLDVSDFIWTVSITVHCSICTSCTPWTNFEEHILQQKLDKQRKCNYSKVSSPQNKGGGGQGKGTEASIMVRALRGR